MSGPVFYNVTDYVGEVGGATKSLWSFITLRSYNNLAIFQEKTNKLG